jgi:nucleoside-diphosphate-sugar epimerase
MPSILLTGGARVIGWHIVDSLLKEGHVAGIRRPVDRIPREPASWI